jgi:signal transduction histidine kinase
MSWFRPRSLTARILLGEATAILVAALLLPLALSSMLGRTTRNYQDEALLDQAETVARALAPDGHGGWHVTLPPMLQSTYHSSYDGRAFAVVDVAGRLRAASRFADPVAWRQSPRGDEPRAFRLESTAGMSLPVAAKGLWVIAMQDENGPGAIVDDVVAAFQSQYLVVLLAVLLLLPLVNSLLVRRLVNSVSRVSEQATQIGPHNLHVRLETSGLPSEMAPLVGAANALLDRLEQSFVEQGQFVANVAHELRTPLAALRLRAGAVEDPAIRVGLDRQVLRLSHVISQLRDLGSLESGAPDRSSRFDLTALAAELVGERHFEMAAAQHPVSFVPGEGLNEIEGNRALVEMALTNLLDNALRHTPAGTQVRVETTGQAVTVADDGPGLVGDGALRATTRFWRADHKRSDSAGLGLSIVRRIMEAHGGTLEIANREPHGAALTLRFPASVGAVRA